MNRIKVGVFASGGGSNLQSILDAASAGRIDAEITVVIGNNSKAKAFERVRQQGIPAYHVSGVTHPDAQSYTDTLLEILQKHNVELIVLAGYMKLLPARVLDYYRNRIINIHPALLPLFGGKGMYGEHVHAAVLAAGCKISGVTVHIVTEEYDKGPIVAQRCVPVQEHDTPSSLAARVLVEEHRIYPDTVQLFALNKVKVVDSKVSIL